MSESVLWLQVLRDHFLQQSPHPYHFVVHTLFGTFKGLTTTTAEAELSQSLRTAFANFAKIELTYCPRLIGIEPGDLGLQVFLSWMNLCTKESWVLITPSILFNTFHGKKFR